MPMLAMVFFFGVALYPYPEWPLSDETFFHILTMVLMGLVPMCFICLPEDVRRLRYLAQWLVLRKNVHKGTPTFLFLLAALAVLTGMEFFVIPNLARRGLGILVGLRSILDLITEVGLWVTLGLILIRLRRLLATFALSKPHTDTGTSALSADFDSLPEPVLPPAAEEAD